MYGIAKLPGEDREILFQNTAAKMGMNAAIIEKDFWSALHWIICFTSANGKRHSRSKAARACPKSTV